MTKTILMIHGFGASGEGWAPAAARFKAAGYAVETPTIHAAHRTVGPPPASLAGKTLADYVAEMSDLAKTLAQRDGDKPVVFGHSMGGLIAQKLAEAGLVSGAVLFAPAPPADARGKTSLSSVFTFLNIAMTPKPETKAVKIWKTGFKWGVLNQTPAERHDTIFATTVHDSGRALSDLAYPDRDPNKTVHVDASKVTAPLLILIGARDRTTPIGDARLVARKYAHATFKEYPNNAHWLIDEPGSDQILAEVETWLDANGLGAKAPSVKAEAAAKAAPEPADAPVERFGPGTKGPKITAKAAPKARAKAAAPKAAKPPASEAITPEPKGPKTAAAKPAKAPTKAKATPAPEAITPEPKGPKTAAAKPAKAPTKAKATPAPEAITPEPKGPKTAAAKPAKAPAKAKATPAPEAITPEPKGPKTAAAKPKAAPAPKVAKAAPVAKPKAETSATTKPVAKVAPKPAAPKPAAKTSTPKAVAKAATAPEAITPEPKGPKTAAAKPKAAPAPKVAKAAPVAKPVAKPKAEAPAKAAPPPEPAVKPKPKAKPVAKAAPAAKAETAQKPTPKTAKAPATKLTAKSSPSTKKSV